MIEVAEEMYALIILKIGKPLIPFAGLKILSTICKFVTHNTRVPIAITLGHGKKMDLIDESIKLDLSVMFDGFLLPFVRKYKVYSEDY